MKFLRETINKHISWSNTLKYSNNSIKNVSRFNSLYKFFYSGKTFFFFMFNQDVLIDKIRGRISNCSRRERILPQYHEKSDVFKTSDDIPVEWRFR